MVAIATVIAGCSGDAGGGSAVDRANSKAQREFDVCQEQADRIADQQGVDAGSAKLDQCVDTLATETQAP